MSILKVARMGHPVLRERARPLDGAEITTPRIQRLIDDMFETMHDSEGIGLAGPQVHESIRLFVAGVDDDDGTMAPVVIINPEVSHVGSEVEEDWEGCLSIPDIRGRVSRALDPPPNSRMPFSISSLFRNTCLFTRVPKGLKRASAWKVKVASMAGRRAAARALD